MVIVPADPRFRQGRWPIATVFLILVNTIVFFAVQGRDDSYRLAAMKLYFDSGLADIEFPLYLNDLRARHKDREADLMQRAFDQQHGVPILMTLEHDRDFLQRLHAGSVIPAERREEWAPKRERFDAAEAKIVTDRYEFDPVAPSPVTLFTHMFLHGGIDHLVGNMLMLALAGFLVEYALGPGLFTALYLLGGLGAGLTYWAVYRNGGMPVIGASGAIAAVMGLFTVLYGRRKVRFFYTLVVYFDFISLPAIVLLPYWLGWEIIQHFISSEPVAYVAHAGGLASGALLALAARKRAPEEARRSLDKPEQDAKWEQALQQSVAHMGRLDFARASAALEKLHAERPNDLRPVLHLFRIAKAQPASEAFHRHARTLLLAKLPEADRIFDDYFANAKPKPRLDAKLQVQLLNRYAVAADCARVDRLLQFAPAPAEKRTVAGILTALATRVPPEKGRAYRDLAARYSSG